MSSASRKRRRERERQRERERERERAPTPVPTHGDQAADPAGNATAQPSFLPEREALHALMRDLYKAMTDLTGRGGRLLYKNLVLPSPKELPDYYTQIKNPIDFGMIQKKINNKEYAVWTDFDDAVMLMFENARTYNSPGDEVYEDATALKKTYVPRRDAALAKFATDYKRGREENYREVCHKLLDMIMEETDEYGRLLGALFEKLPSRRALPEYYAVIKDPVDVVTIRARIENMLIVNVAQFETHVLRMFSNAQTFNEKGSEVYEDATALMRVFRKHKEAVKRDALKSLQAPAPAEAANAPPTQNHHPAEAQPPPRKKRLKISLKTSAAAQAEAAPSEAAQAQAPPPPDPAQAQAAPGGAGPDAERDCCSFLLSIVTSHKNRKGRIVSEFFEELPKKKELPHYYDVITDPLDIKTIQKYTKSPDAVFDTFCGMMDTMFSNAKSYNEIGSEIFNDAVTLQRLFNKYRDRLKSQDMVITRVDLPGRRSTHPQGAPLDPGLDRPAEPQTEPPKPHPEPPAGDEDPGADEEAARREARAEKERQRREHKRERDRERRERLKAESRARREREQGEEAAPQPKRRLTIKGPTKAAPAPAARPSDVETLAPQALELLYAELGDDGFPIYEDFDVLPSKEEMPEYYEVIKDPMDLQGIRGLLERKEVTTMDKFDLLVTRVFENAQRFNEDESQIHQDATRLLRLFLKHREKQKSGRVHKAGVADVSRAATGLTPVSSSSGHLDQHPGRPAATKKELKTALMRMYMHMYNYESGGDDSYKMCDNQSVFFRLPTRNQLPDYYRIIKEPVDMETLRTSVNKERYANVGELYEDMRLMFENARYYNAEGSDIYEDATVLMTALEAIKDTMDHERSDFVRMQSKSLSLDAAKISHSHSHHKPKAEPEAARPHKEPVAPSASASAQPPPPPATATAASAPPPPDAAGPSESKAEAGPSPRTLWVSKRLPPSVTAYDFGANTIRPAPAPAAATATGLPPSPAPARAEPGEGQAGWKRDEPEFYNYTRVEQQVVEGAVQVPSVCKALGHESRPDHKSTPAQKMEKMLALLRRLEDDTAGAGTGTDTPLYYASYFDTMPTRLADPDFYNQNKNPLSFGKIKAMFRSGAYKSVDHFFADVDSLLQQGLRSSVPGSRKHGAASKLLDLAHKCATTILGDVVEAATNESVACFEYLAAPPLLDALHHARTFVPHPEEDGGWKAGDCVFVETEPDGAPPERVVLCVTRVGTRKAGKAGACVAGEAEAQDEAEDEALVEGRVLIPFSKASRPVWDLYRPLAHERLLSDIVRHVRAEDIRGRVVVLARDRYMTHDVAGYKGSHAVLCCSSEYLHHERITRPLLGTTFNLGPGMHLQEREKPLATPPMPARTIVEHQKDKDIVLGKSTADQDVNLLEQVGLPEGVLVGGDPALVLVVGDSVLVTATTGAPMLMLVTQIEKRAGPGGECVLTGRRYLRPEETVHHPKRLFLVKEVMLSPVKEQFCYEAVAAKCWVVPIELHVRGFPMSKSTDFIFVCEYSYHPDSHVFQHDPHVQRRARSAGVLCDRFCVYKEPVHIRRAVASPHHNDPGMMHRYQGRMPDYGVRPFVPPGTVVGHGGWRPTRLSVAAREKAKSYGIVEAHLDTLVFDSGPYLLQCPHVTALSLFAGKVRGKVRELLPDRDDDEVERTVATRFARLDPATRTALEHKAAEEMDLWKVEEARARLRVNAKIGRGELTQAQTTATLQVPVIHRPQPPVDPTTIKEQVKKLYDPVVARREAVRCGQAEGRAMFDRMTSRDPRKKWSAATATVMGHYSPVTDEMNINDVDPQIAMTLAQGDVLKGRRDVLMPHMLDARVGLSLKRLQRHVFRTELMHRQQWSQTDGEALRTRISNAPASDGDGDDGKKVAVAPPASLQDGGGAGAGAGAVVPDPNVMRKNMEALGLDASQFGIGQSRPEPCNGAVVAFALGGTKYAGRVPTSEYQVFEHGARRDMRRIVNIAIQAERPPTVDCCSDGDGSDTEDIVHDLQVV